MARGRRIYLVLAAITVVVKLGGLFPILDNHYSWQSKLIPIVIALSVISLWWGTEWIQRLAGWAFILSGALTLSRFARSLDSLDIYGISVGFTLLLGLVDILAGVAILKLAALDAFFRYRRENRLELIAPIQKQRIGPACFWGMVLSTGSGLLLASRWAESIHFDLKFQGQFLSVLGGMGAFALLGVTAGLAVGLVGTGAGSTKRYVTSRGLIAAGACVVAGVLGAAIYGGLYGPDSSDFSAAAGWPRAGLWAVMWLVLGSPMLAALGVALGVPIALLIRDDEVVE